MNDINDMNSLVQDVIDGNESPEKAMKVLNKRRERTIEETTFLTKCLEEIEGSDIEDAQRKVLRNRMSGYLHTVTEGLENLKEILNTTKETELSKRLEYHFTTADYMFKFVKEELG